MRAMAFDRYGDAGVLHAVELPVPAPGPGEVQVRVHATTVNPIDWKLRKGRMRLVLPVRFPRVPGFDLAGEVSAVGHGVTRFKAGDAVFGVAYPRKNGAAAEYTVVPEGQLFAKPPRLSFDAAAAVPGSALTARDMLIRLARVREGARVLVIGAAGGVGHFAVQIARAQGARVTGVCSSRNAQRVREMGADVIAYDREKVARDARFDVIIDTVHRRGFVTYARYLTRGGCYVATLPDVALLVVPLLWLFGYRKRCSFVMSRPTPEGLSRLYDLIQAGQLAPWIGHTFPLERLAAAHALSETGHASGKIVIRVMQ